MIYKLQHDTIEKILWPEIVAPNRGGRGGEGDTGKATDGSDTDWKLIPLNECATKTRDNWEDESAARQNQNKQPNA